MEKERKSSTTPGNTADNRKTKKILSPAEKSKQMKRRYIDKELLISMAIQHSSKLHGIIRSHMENFQIKKAILIAVLSVLALLIIT